MLLFFGIAVDDWESRLANIWRLSLGNIPLLGSHEQRIDSIQTDIYL